MSCFLCLLRVVIFSVFGVLWEQVIFSLLRVVLAIHVTLLVIVNVGVPILEAMLYVVTLARLHPHHGVAIVVGTVTSLADYHPKRHSVSAVVKIASCFVHLFS
jgi:hypothetical protein